MKCECGNQAQINLRMHLNPKTEWLCVTCFVGAVCIWAIEMAEPSKEEFKVEIEFARQLASWHSLN